MSLIISSAHSTLTGPRSHNEDFVGIVTPDDPELSNKGVLAAIADGVSGNDGGREAAEYAVRGLLTDYYATPETWPITQCLDRVIKAINSWVQSQGSKRQELAGMASTLTALVLRGNFYYFAHVGDSRLYLLRAGVLLRLTTDHVWDRPEMRHVLTRAIGLDSRLAIDHGTGELRQGDVFLLATDGVWDANTEYELNVQLSALALGNLSAGDAADALTGAAEKAGSRDNMSAMVLKVESVPAADLRDSISVSRHLPLPRRLKPGLELDGYTVEAMIHSSRTTMLYKVREPVSGRPLVLKTLHPDCDQDQDERSAFAHEEWLARRAVARFFAQVVNPVQRNYLYYLTTWHDGHTLQQNLDSGRHFTVPEVIVYATQLARAVGALHRRSILHRDIKPANVHLGSDEQLRLLDFGVAQSGLDAGIRNHAPQAGTPSFLAPEQFDNAPPSRQTDLYATGVTLYLMLTRHYPYGEIEAFQRPRFAEPAPPSRYRPDLPVWLDNVLLKAVARDPSQRFETAEELMLALERGASRPLAAPATSALAERDPMSLWRGIALVSVVINFLLLYLLTMR